MKTKVRFNSELLKKCRQQRRFTQGYVADQLKIDVRTLRAYETGEVNEGGFCISRDVGCRLDDMTTLFKLEGGRNAWLVTVSEAAKEIIDAVGYERRRDALHALLRADRI